MRIKPITPCLWFDRQAEDAARFYVGVFPNSRITRITNYPNAVNDLPAGAVLTVAFELDGQPFTALNGGPIFTFNESISFQVMCDTQQDIDLYWEKLSAGGDPAAQQCGWLKDRFGLSWQIIPTELIAMLSDADPARTKRVMAAFMPMKKFDIAALERAYEGS